MFLVALKQYYLGTFLSLLFLKKETVPQPWRAIAQRFGSIEICGDDEMIRQYANCDIDTVMQIWLNTNTQAHNFISTDY